MTAARAHLTEEQRDVVTHDTNAHATVLAVAGAGKTTTLVHRIMHLIEEAGVSPGAIRAVMFNRSAREDFQRKMASVAEQEGAPSWAQNWTALRPEAAKRWRRSPQAWRTVSRERTAVEAGSDIRGLLEKG